MELNRLESQISVIRNKILLCDKTLLKLSAGISRISGAPKFDLAVSKAHASVENESALKIQFENSLEEHSKEEERSSEEKEESTKQEEGETIRMQCLGLSIETVENSSEEHSKEERRSNDEKEESAKQDTHEIDSHLAVFPKYSEVVAVKDKYHVFDFTISSNRDYTGAMLNIQNMYSLSEFHHLRDKDNFSKRTFFRTKTNLKENMYSFSRVSYFMPFISLILLGSYSAHSHKISKSRFFK
jgi:hypothetical protein